MYQQLTMHLLSFALVLTTAPLAGCGDDSTATTCEAGRQIPCACGGGEEGYQRCRTDGSGYDECVCEGVMDAGQDTGATDAAADSGGGDSAVADSAIDSGADAGSLVCDTGEEHDVSSAECNECIMCASAEGGPCEAAVAACDAEPDCEAFDTCTSLCGDDLCIDQCVRDHETGAMLRLAWQDCAFCVNCPNNCSMPAGACAP